MPFLKIKIKTTIDNYRNDVATARSAETDVVKGTACCVFIIPTIRAIKTGTFSLTSWCTWIGYISGQI